MTADLLPPPVRTAMDGVGAGWADAYDAAAGGAAHPSAAFPSLLAEADRLLAQTAQAVAAARDRLDWYRLLWTTLTETGDGLARVGEILSEGCEALARGQRVADILARHPVPVDGTVAVVRQTPA